MKIWYAGTSYTCLTMVLFMVLNVGEVQLLSQKSSQFTSAEYWYWFANELSAPVMLLSLFFPRHWIPLNVFCYVTFVLVPPALMAAEHKDCLCLKVSSWYPLLGLRCEKRKDKELLWHGTVGNIRGKQNLVYFVGGGTLNVTPWKKPLATSARPEQIYQAKEIFSALAQAFFF